MLLFFFNLLNIILKQYLYEMRLLILKVSLGDKTDYGYLAIKVKSPYVKGVVGSDIRLRFWDKLKILFSSGISVSLIGPDVYKKR